MCTLSVCVTFCILEHTPTWVCGMKWNLARQRSEKRETGNSTLFTAHLISHYPANVTDRYRVTAKAALSFQKFCAVARRKLQNLISFAFQTRGTPLCSSAEIKQNFVFSNGNHFALGKHEWLDLKPGIYQYTVSKTVHVTWQSGK